MSESPADYDVFPIPEDLRRGLDVSLDDSELLDLPEAKPWWESRAIWGAIVTAAAGLLSIAGYTMDVPAATEAVLGLVAIVGAALSWYGRVRAQRPISRAVIPGVDLPERG